MDYRAHDLIKLMARIAVEKFIEERHVSQPSADIKPSDDSNTSAKDGKVTHE